jgi:hypothetical protein
MIGMMARSVGIGKLFVNTEMMMTFSGLQLMLLPRMKRKIWLKRLKGDWDRNINLHCKITNIYGSGGERGKFGYS